MDSRIQIQICYVHSSVVERTIHRTIEEAKEILDIINGFFVRPKCYLKLADTEIYQEDL